MRITKERNRGMSWEMAGIIEMLSVRTTKRAIEPTEMIASALSCARKEARVLGFKISLRLSCSRSTPETTAPPKKKNGIWSPGDSSRTLVSRT